MKLDFGLVAMATRATADQKRVIQKVQKIFEKILHDLMQNLFMYHMWKWSLHVQLMQ